LSYFYFLSLIVAVVVRAQTSCHLRELDLCLAPGLAGGQSLPTTVAEINKQCSTMKETNECLSDYSSSCTTKPMRELMGLVSQQGDVKSWYSEFCTKDNAADRAKYLKHAVCLNGAQKEARSCTKDLIVALDKAIVANPDDRMPQMCCAIRRMRKCSSDIVEKKCGKEGLKYSNQMAQSVSPTRFPEIMCREFDPTSQKCTSILPAPGTKPSGDKSKSVLSRLLNTFSAL
jgi:hypothetical protein